jgi:hypothetical protein
MQRASGPLREARRGIVATASGRSRQDARLCRMNFEGSRVNPGAVKDRR